MVHIRHSLSLIALVGQSELNIGSDRARNNGLNSLKRIRKKRPKRSRFRQDLTRLRNRKVQEDLLVNTATTNSSAPASRRGNGIKEDRGTSKVFLKRRMPRTTTTTLLLARNVGRSIWGIAELEPIVATYVAGKAIMPRTAMPISRTRRTARETREINFTQHN